MSAPSMNVSAECAPLRTRFDPDELRRMGKAEARRLSDALIRRLRELPPECHEYGEVRGAIVELNLPLVRYAARKFGARRQLREDVRQTGIVGLIKAVDAFDPDRGVEFATFALPTITGEIKRFFRDTVWPVHVARSVQENFLAVVRTADRLEQDLGREVADGEIAREVGITDEQVRIARDASRAYQVDSLDAVHTGTEAAPDSARTPLVERLGYDDKELDLVDFRTSVKPLIEDLPERDQLLIELRFWEGMSQREIGERLGVSQMHVSRLLARTLGILRGKLEADGPQSGSPPVCAAA